MSVKETKDLLDIEISRRLTSAEWGGDIASLVISRRNKKMKRNILVASSISLISTAASVVFIFFFNTVSINQNDLELFISNQVEGTHKTVFKENYSKNLLYVSSSEEADPVDSLITNALSVR